ncbi:acylphosphatase [Blastochloris viridis]|nr:acylphosphatase [Blastochloris viridis]ALK09201.1 Acylphosphatase [Blastochloris viridis]CUU41864.1 Acylphosphatase [Blastochloris viridis]
MTVVRLTVRGRVQGVGFRYFVERTAARLGVDGWVRNRADGSVEAVAAGEDAAVAAMIEACRRGPPAARVDSLEVAGAGEADLAGRPPGEAFSVLATR